MASRGTPHCGARPCRPTAPHDVYSRVTIPLSSGATDVGQLWMVTAQLQRFAAGLPARARDLDPALFA